MYICICNGVSEKDLRRAARTGARTTEQAYASMGIELSCAQYVEYAQTIIDGEHKPFVKAS